jgi:predicted MPP superfamily phosphohydrolase
MWMGFLTYLFLASVLYGILFMLTGELHLIIGRLLIFIAFLLSIYGFFHAQKIIVKNIKVSLPNLPPLWHGRKAIWISDIHVGQLYDHNYTQRIVDIANSIPHDIFFIGGDLYDGTQAPDLLKAALPFENVNAPLGVYFITGNHEEFGDNTKFIHAIRSVDIHTLINEMIEIDGMQIIGLDYRDVSHKKDFKKILSTIPFDVNKPSILLKHDPRDIEVAAHAGIALQISGHTHKAQIWPLGFIAKIIYGDFIYGFHHFKKMQVYTSSGAGTWGPPMRVGSDSEIVVFTFE